VDVEVDHNRSIRLAPLLRRLHEMGFPVKDTMVSYKSIVENALIYVGKEPLIEDAVVNTADLEQPTNRLTLRCRQ